MIIKILIKIYFACLVIWLFQGCAKIANPSGGPSDVTPPEYINSSPENRSTNFNNDEIDIYFNEYIQLKDQNTEIIMSPPMKEKPVVRVREKSLRILFNEDLKPETTYTINFGKSLSDLNEGNLLPDFEYVFSTGKNLDSLSITGFLKDAFTEKHDPKTSIFVMLYKDSDKTSVYSKIPDYYGKANNNGIFAVNNVSSGIYSVVAVEDLNNNLKYDRGLEKMAFLDSALNLSPVNVSRQVFIKDTVKIITSASKSKKINRKNTTETKADTIIASGKILNTVNLSMRYFTELDDKVFLSSYKRESKEKFSFIFNRPLYKDLIIKPLNFSPDSNWFLAESSFKKDSFNYWITSSKIASKDTLKLQLTYLTVDSNRILYSKLDTIILRKELSINKERNSNTRRGKNDEKKSEDTTLIINSNVVNNSIADLHSSISFKISRPLKNIVSENIELYRMEDTLYIPETFEIERDTLLKSFNLKGNWIEDTKYKLLLKPRSVYDIYNLTNDSLEIKFTTQKEDYYGKIIVNFTSFQYPMILQLLNSKNSVVRYININSPGIITFENLTPGNYSFKAVYDKNQNGKWDTGNFLNNIQPEEVFLSGKIEQLRSNWDLDLTWNISKQLQ